MRLTHQDYGNGLDRTINFYRADRLRSSEVLSKGAQTIDDLSMVYTYAVDKQVTSEQITGDLLPSSGFTSSYDAGNRLTNWSSPTSATTTKAQTWNYDNAGNWDSTDKTIGTTTTTENRTHSAADQLTNIGGEASTNDLKGNLTEYEIKGIEYTVTYDLDNRISKVEVDNDDVEYRYDAFGRRVIRKEGSTSTSLIWWGNSECAEHKHQAGQTVIQNDIMEHPSRLNSVIARAVDGSKFKLQWYHKNYLDHVYAVSDDSGDILEHYRYTAFGEVTIYDENGNLENSTQIENTILWNTRRRDEVTGYYMYKYRHYSPELGRWPSRDPIGENGGVNLYAFVGNAPTVYWDGLGLIKIPNPKYLEQMKQALLNLKLDGKGNIEPAGLKKLMDLGVNDSISSRSFTYQAAHGALLHEKKECGWFAAAMMVTSERGIGMVEDPVGKRFVSDDMSDFLAAGNEHLFMYNLKMFAHLLHGRPLSPTLDNGVYIPGSGKIDYGKALDKRLVQIEQARVQAFIVKYKKDNGKTTVEMKKIMDEINGGFNGNLKQFAQGFIIRRAVKDVTNKTKMNFDFSNQGQRVMLGDSMIEDFYRQVEKEKR